MYPIELLNKQFEHTDRPDDEISVLDYNEIDYESFFKNYLDQNIPCIIKNVTQNWNCNKFWLKDSKEIDYKYIIEKYGESYVPVANCSEQFYNAQKKIDMQLSEYLKYCIGRTNNDNSELLYLKDWHFTKSFPEDNIYTVPIYFVSDWLNEYSLDNNEDDFMFVYMGPKGTWTPFHADVYSSFSWSVNVTGKKRWILFPPNVEKSLADNLGNLPYDVTQTEKFINGNIKYYEVFQNPGEALFVPSCWHHQVWNVQDTLSINHNWINGCNIQIVWESMQQSLSDIKSEISDCQDMELFDEHCQLMLNAMFGMDFNKFFKLLYHISLKRLNKLLNTSDVILFGTYSLEKEHCKFDLKRILTVLQDFGKNEDAMKIDWSKQETTPKEFIIKIENILL